MMIFLFFFNILLIESSNLCVNGYIQNNYFLNIKLLNDF